MSAEVFIQDVLLKKKEKQKHNRKYLLLFGDHLCLQLLLL